MHRSFNHIRQVAPMCTQSNTWFLGRTRVYHRNGIVIGSAIFAALTCVLNTQTQRPQNMTSVAIGRIDAMHVTF